MKRHQRSSLERNPLATCFRRSCWENISTSGFRTVVSGEFDRRKDYLKDETRFESDEILETDSKEDKLEKTRRKAFVDDAVQFETPAFWKNYIEQRSQARKLHQKMSMGSWKRSPRDADDDIQIVAVRRRTSIASTPSRQSSVHSGSNRSKKKKQGHLPTPGPTPVKGWK